MVTGEKGGKCVQCGTGASFDMSISDIDKVYIRLIRAPSPVGLSSQIGGRHPYNWPLPDNYCGHN